MKRALAVLVAALAVACQDHGPADVPPPLAAISDGAHSAGNPDFFFLPPIASNPSSDPNFEPAEFNAALSPTVEVCTWSGTSCGAVVASFTMTSGLGSETIQVGVDQYAVNWHTDLSNLDPALTYRIRVLVGSTQLGFADVDVVSTGRELRNVNTQEFIGLQNGRTLPIKFRIENAALCTPAGSDACASETIDLSAGGDVIIPQTGDRIDIPPQTSGQVVTLTVEYCDGIETDLPTFGPCIHVTTDPPLSEALSPRAVVSICSLAPITGLTEEQEDLVTVLRRDGEVISALPHAADVCPEVIGNRPTGLRGLLFAGWNALAVALGPPPLHASLTMLDVGGGGETEGFSDFQLALPALMTRLPGTDAQHAAPGQAVPVPPGVKLTDWHGDPVAGASVLFEEGVDTDNDGLADSWESRGWIDSNSDGVAQVDSWVLDHPGFHSFRASGRGIADPADLHPFMPDITDPTPEQEVVPVGSGELVFNALASSSNDIAATVGTSGVDGTMSAGEWDPAGCVNFLANLPEGGSTPAQLCVMNDATTLYTAVRFARTLVDPGNTLALEFDNDHDGVAENGDDVLLHNPGSSPGFHDEFRTNIPPCTPGSGEASCGFFDTDDGGSNDGAGAFANDGTHSVYEMSHPLNSPDNAHDFSLRYGQEVGAFLSLRMLAAGAEFPVGFGDTDFPGVRNYLTITIATPVTGTVTIDDVDLTTTVLAIGGVGVPYSAFVTNGTGVAISNAVVVQGWIDQGSASRAAGGTQVLCGAGIGVLPPGTCEVSFTLGASNTASGSGTLVPGAATARFELHNASGTFDTFTVPITLVKAVTIDDVDLSPTELAIGGVQASYTATVSNRTASTLANFMVLQGWIDQGAATRAAGGLQLHGCGTGGTGELPPGTCLVSFSFGASNTGAGSGTLVPGAATARWELKNNDGTFDEFTIPITLVDPVTIDDVNLTSSSLTIGGAGVPYTATVSNRTGASLTVVVVQAYIEQGTAVRAANGLQVVCGSGVGVLPPGTCMVDFTVAASNTGSGSGTLVPGAANARFELRDGAGSTLYDVFNVPVTLVP